MVEPCGTVVSVDSSETMIAEARWRLYVLDLPLEYAVEPAAAGLRDRTFDGRRAIRSSSNWQAPSRLCAS